jgi:hypothetical protein
MDVAPSSPSLAEGGTQTALTDTALRAHALRAPGWQHFCPTCGHDGRSGGAAAAAAAEGAAARTLAEETAARAAALTLARERVAAAAEGAWRVRPWRRRHGRVGRRACPAG